MHNNTIFSENEFDQKHYFAYQNGAPLCIYQNNKFLGTMSITIKK